MLYVVRMIPDVVCCWNDPRCFVVGMIPDVVCSWNDPMQVLFAGRERFQVLSSSHICVVCLHSMTFEFPKQFHDTLLFESPLGLELFE